MLIKKILENFFILKFNLMNQNMEKKALDFQRGFTAKVKPQLGGNFVESQAEERSLS